MSLLDLVCYSVLFCCCAPRLGTENALHCNGMQFMINWKNNFRIKKKNTEKLVSRNMVIVVEENVQQNKPDRTERNKNLTAEQKKVIVMFVLTGSVECLRSQITSTYMEDDPLMPSLSNGAMSTRFFVPGGIFTGESRSRNDRFMSPFSVWGFPFILSFPITVPTSMSSLARKLSAEPPPSR